MKIKLLKYLVCPECKSHFEITVQKREGEEVMEGELLCNSCDKTFPIRRGIPRILMGQDYHLKKETQKNFAFSWKKFSSIYEDERDFLDWIYPKNKEFFKNKIVLDAGCGTGKHASFASQFGAKEVIAFDLSDSVEVAFDINRQLDNVHIIQTDIYYLPFKEDFDYVYCIGVLQHLPDPEKGFYNLSKLLRKKGWISIWVYGYEGTTFVRKFIDPIRKHLTSKMPPSLVLALSFFPATIFYLLAKGLYKPLSKFKPTTKILKFMPMSSYIVYISQFNFLHIFNSVFDQLIAPITKYFCKEDIEEWFKKANLKNIKISNRNNMSWRATGQNF